MVRQVERPDSLAKKYEDCIPTAGNVFDDGILELVREERTPKQLSLLSSNGNKFRIASRFERNGEVYVPLRLAPSLIRGIRFSSGCKPYTSTDLLFTQVSNLFRTHCGLSTATSNLATFFVLATYFADCFQTAPFLVLVGSENAEATRVLRLLGCLCYHSLLLGDVGPAGLFSIPGGLAVTLLIGQRDLSAATKRFLSVSNFRDFGFLKRGELRIPYNAKAVYVEQCAAGDDFIDGAVRMCITPSRGMLTPITVQKGDEIAAEFQPRLLAYRLENYDRVINSAFRVTGLTRHTREMAYILGSCVVASPQLQADIVSLLAPQDEVASVIHTFQPASVVVEALLALCHEDRHETVLIGDVTKLANGILAQRGESLGLQPRKVGAILKSLGLFATQQHRICVLLVERNAASDT
jgi:hypothetical protein